jgi:hypothetical protein
MKQEHIDYMSLEDPARAFRQGREIAALAAWCASADNSLHHRRGSSTFPAAGDVLSPARASHRDRWTGSRCSAVRGRCCSPSTTPAANISERPHAYRLGGVGALHGRPFASFASILLTPTGNPQVMRTRRPWLQLAARRCCSARRLNFFALRYLQLDEAVAIIFCTPFIVAALGGPMLGEWIAGGAGPRSSSASAASCW